MEQLSASGMVTVQNTLMNRTTAAKRLQMDVVMVVQVHKVSELDKESEFCPAVELTQQQTEFCSSVIF